MINFPERSYLTIGAGVTMDLANPDPNLITPEIVAASLYYQNRYAGHLSFPYPVLNHTFIVALAILSIFDASEAQNKLAFIGLVHDDTEAIVSDIPHPVKVLLPQFTELEKHIWDKAIAPAWGLEPDDIDNPIVVKVDKSCWDLEECVVHFGDPRYAIQIDGPQDIKGSEIERHVLRWLNAGLSYYNSSEQAELLAKYGLKTRESVDVGDHVYMICKQLLWGCQFYQDSMADQVQLRVDMQRFFSRRYAGWSLKKT